ncbi:VPS9 and MORN and RCC1 domain containing protein [Trichuris trichiura]|uniref:VPS9 and MORN and RCC1 domain containing protein n=1 Tax=Trichuris trichiura TaxID=36087 RepID=A0A077Z860_TRITR|nr:VPS9 and MORN and RCC1 domain containing protein [Trichuris trichiura]
MDESSEHSSLYSPLAAIRVVSVCCAFGTVGVITDSHKVLMWGRSDHGQCGFVTECIKEPVQVTICVKEMCDDSCHKTSHPEVEVQKISISRYQTLAIDSSNALWAWGTPLEGQSAILVPYRVSQLSGRHVLAVASGFGHYVVLVNKLVGNTGALHQLSELKSVRSCPSPSSDEREATENEKYLQFDYSENKSECHSEEVPPNGYCPLGVKLTSADGTTASLDQPANEVGHSLLGKLVTKFGTCSVSSAEDKFEMLEMPNLSNAANRLSFVSRDLIQASISSSESSPFVESSFAYLNAKEAKGTGVDSSIAREERSVTSTEVWTWGLNKLGQLGCTDCDNRLEPERLSILDEAGIVSIDAGAFHTVALSCTAEAYVWGSNEDGQIKLSDRLYVAEPTIFKAGSCLKVIELAAGSHFTALLMIGQDLQPQCYVCGCKNLGIGQSVVRVEFPSSVVPLSMYFSNECLVQGCVKAFLDDHSKLPVDCLCKAQYSLMDQNHLLKQLAKILEWISTEDCVADSYNKLLLKNFSRSLKIYRANAMKSYMSLRALLHSADPFACLKSLFRTLRADEYQSGDAEVSVRRLSDVYSVVYEKIGRIMEELFFLPFVLFGTMYLITAELQKDDQFFKETSNFLLNIGKVFRFYKNKAYDTQKLRTTYRGDSSGSLYEGYYKDNKPEGHGALRTAESLFVGEWKKGVKNGYGVLEKSRTKYLGIWEGDLPNGIGVLVTLDGVCCRGSFVKDSFRKGVLYLPDGMVVKGEFANSECLNGKAAVYFPSGECLNGSFYGRIQDSVQITSGSLQKCSARNIVVDEATFPSADMKWSDVFRHAYDLLGQSSVEECDTDKAWESLAAYCGKVQCSSPVEKGTHVKLKNGLIDVFNLSYSGTGVHRCLLLDAVQETKSIFLRFYKYVRILFPSLPPESEMNNLVSEIDHTTPRLSWSLETFSSFICGNILQSIYPNLFTLYVIKNEDSDKAYQLNIRHVNSKSDVMLLDHLGVDREFWPIVFNDTADLDKPSACITARMQYYSKAIDCFQRLSSEFSPIDKFKIIAETFEHVNRCVSENCENVLACPWTADNLVPITTYVLIRAQIQRLGAELNFIRDFAPSLDEAGEIQYMFTTLQCCYQFLVQSKNIG